MEKRRRCESIGEKEKREGVKKREGSGEDGIEGEKEGARKKEENEYSKKELEGLIQ